MLTNKMNLPQPFVDAASMSHTYKPNRYSVTEVLGGTCEAVLKRRHQGEQDEDVSDRFWAVLGSAVHKILEESRGTDTQLQEQWFSVPIDGTDYEMSGIFDLYDDATGTVTDWKTCGTIKVLKGEFDDYRLQVLMYCLMLRKHGFDAHKGEIVMIMRDWVKSKARYEADYPKVAVHKVSWEFTENDFLEAEMLINNWFAELAEQQKLKDTELAPCSEEKRWHRPDKWAVTKNGVKRATKVLDNENTAKELAERLSKKGKSSYHVEYRKGEDVKCELYCSMKPFCPLFKSDV